MPLTFIIKPDPYTQLGVWQIKETVQELAENLSLGNQDQILYSEIRNESRKKQWLSCRKILQAMLNQDHIDIIYDTHGKPWLTNINTYISFSHTGSYASAILSEKNPVGIDLEQKKSRIFRIAERFLHPEEWQGIGSENRLEKLYIHWCSKEAIIKLIGFPGIDFKNDIRVESFDYLCSGSIFISVNLNAETSLYQAKYHDVGDFILVYVVQTR